MQSASQTTNNQTTNNSCEIRKPLAPTSGLRVRTDLRAGLAWDDLDVQAQALWDSLTSAASGLAGAAETGS